MQARMATGAQTPVEETARSRQQHRRGVSPTRRGLVLVVEDNPNDWEIYGKILWYNGFDVLYAQDGATACELLERYRPDLVLLDLMLPDMDGFELCHRLKKVPRMAGVPIVILSGRPAAEFGAPALQAGCVQYVEKPALPVDVLHTVEHLIGRPPPAGVGRSPRKVPPTA
jgi:DNA-binding response OmpR family regulator